MPEVITPSKGAIVRMEGTASELTAIASVNAEALAAREEAQLKAQVGLALKFPRTVEQFETNIAKECRRYGFAEKARYSLPRSTYENGQRVQKSITGWTVRFAETAMRLYRNLNVRQIIVSEDREQRVIEVSVFDLESVVTDSRQMVISKTIERRQKYDKDIVVAERRTSTGEVVYILAANEADMLAKTMGMVSRLRRNLILEMIPADILANAEAIVASTIAADVKKDPDEHKKKLLAAYESYGVSPRQLHEYLGKPLNEVGEKDLGELRSLYEALKSGETSWDEVMREKGSGTTAPPEPKKTPPKGEGISAVDPRDDKTTTPTASGKAGPAPEPKPPTKVEPLRLITKAAGSKEHAEEVLAAIRACETVEQLRAIAGATQKAHRDWKGGIDASYSSKLEELQKAGK